MRVFCQSQGEINHLVDRGLSLNKAVLCGLPPMCRVYGNGEEFRSNWYSGTKPMVLFIGRRDEGKGFPGDCSRDGRPVLDRIPELSSCSPDREKPVISPDDSIVDLVVPNERDKSLRSGSLRHLLPSIGACDPSASLLPRAWSYA